jgi:hypothetical protein
MGDDSSNFAIVEYKEAVAAYFRVVDIGYTSLRLLLTVNAGLFVFYTAVSRMDLLQQNTYVSLLIPIFGLGFSLVTFMNLPQYYAHINNARDRAADIEKNLGGLLFSNLKKISEAEAGRFKTKNFVNSYIALFCVLWTSVMIVAAYRLL